ncbi:fimbrillin family protein [Bacteroides sp. 51]|uniref:fimbrillin family protein n=1 Tax=Bacteroides sp. 51 TaxID=2302938 RepID=UPI0013D4D8C1|nr:fimbrillin family protein [Bacteroides sp. 51]NDV80525.1 fimbrillin family protein [Bacteroides sp. 51]
MKKKLFLGMLASFALFSCGGSDDDPKVEETQVPIYFSSQVNIREKSRATDAGFESNDQIGVYITKWNGSTQTSLKSSGNYVDNKLYTYSSSGFSASPLAYYPEDGSKIDVYAYYPYSELSSSTNVSFTVKPDQSTQSGYTKSDLMTSTVSGRSTSTSAIPLTFNHALAKVIINLDSKTVPAGTKSITLENIYTSCNYNLSSGECSTKGSKSQIVLKADGTNRFIGVLPPQTFNSGQLLATISINGEPYTWKPTSNVSFASNTETEYTLEFENGDAVAFTATINPWGKPKINEVVPTEMQEKIKDYMPIYNGSTPPNVMGTYLCSPNYMIHSSIPGETNDDYDFADRLFRFSNQNFTNNTLDYDSKQGADGQSSGKGYFISGSGDNFTVFFNTTGTSYGISIKMATVISGTKTSQGIKNYRYAFLMLEKGPDPENKLVEVGTFRIFKDENELASNSTWTNTRSLDWGTGQSIYSANK